jgi:hypothetical protein
MFLFHEEQQLFFDVKSYKCNGTWLNFVLRHFFLLSVRECMEMYSEIQRIVGSSSAEVQAKYQVNF